MRGARLAAVLLLALAGCSLGTEGAPCRNADNCAEGLACGGSGTCTRAAARCGDLGNRPLCKVGELKCAGGDTVLQGCRGDDRGEECASFQVKDTCGAHERCGVTGGVASCACDTSLPCWAAQQAYCDGTSGERVACAQDADGCWFEESRAGCTGVETCRPGTSGATCACPDTRCTSPSSAFCDPSGIITCLDVGGCNVEQPVVGCGLSRGCTGPDGSAACTCLDPGGCGDGVLSLCDGQGKVIACVTEANGCRHPDAQALPCQSVHQTCGAPAGTAGSCQCVDDRCADGRSSFCDANGKLVTCAKDAALCPFESPPADCDPAQTCASLPTTPASAECRCPAAGAIAGAGCTQGASPICGGSGVLECRQAPGSTCFVWTPGASCATSQLVCNGGACVCPAATGEVFFADSASGGAAGASPAPTGAQNPPQCRFVSIEEALARANAVPLGGGEVRATGASALNPMIFLATGALSIGAGVTVTTTDSPLGTANYTLQAPAGLGANAFVTLGAGATLSGFHLQNDGGTGAALATNCATGSIDPVLVNTVRISGAGASNRFSAGLSQASPDCPATLRNADVQGVGHGVDVTAGSLAVEGGAFSGNERHVHAQPGGAIPIAISVSDAILTGASDSAVRLLGLGTGSTATLARNQIRSNAFTTAFTVAGGPRGGGGVVFTGPFADVVVFAGNELRSNKGDQVLVAASGGTLNLVGDPGCTATPLINRFGCYDAPTGRGIFSNGATVNVDGNSWVFQPAQTGSDVGGSGVRGFDTNACAPANLACP